MFTRHEDRVEFDWDRSKQYFFFYPPIAILKELDVGAVWRKTISLYFHIPFCVRKCRYCYYVSLPGEQCQDGIVAEYLRALEAELRWYARLLERDGLVVTSVYFGGGTPTYLPARSIVGLLQMVRENFHVDPAAEITVDGCPATLTDEKIEELYAAGIRRICMGVQTFDDEILSKVNRGHSGADAAERLEAMKRKGIEYRVVDLMYGLPYQNMEKVQRDLEQIKALMPEGLSFYRLSLRPGTCLYMENVQNRAIWKFPSEEVNLKMNEQYLDFISGLGYRQVATPAFAMPPRDFLHQRNYWDGGAYIGMGVSSFSFYNNYVFVNTRSVPKYIDALARTGVLPVETGERLSPRELMHREVCLRVKLLELDLGALSEKYEVDLNRYFRDEIDVLLRDDLARECAGKLALTKRGIIYNDNVSRLFYSDRTRVRLRQTSKEAAPEKNLI